MALVANIKLGFEAVAAAFKYLLYLPVKPVDGDYTMAVVGGTASWRSAGRGVATGAATVAVAGTVNVTCATLTYNAPAAGVYRVEWACLWLRSVITSSLIIEALIDGVITRDVIIESSDTTNKEGITLIAYPTLTAGAHTIILRARGELASASTIYTPTISAERWS
jgi:hypothetical protein